MTKIVVTTCSIHHISQAKSLGDSLHKFNPDYKLVIGLVDKIEGRLSPDFYHPHDLIEVEEMNLAGFGDMYQRYTTLELNCALKSFFIDHVMDRYKPDLIFFLDSDILAFDSFQAIEDQLRDHSILICPHITTPFPRDNSRPQEKDILKTGIYNAGFVGLKNDGNARSLMTWLKERMIDQCYERPKEGLNVDQKWFNLVPLYFDKVKILAHAGCNVAYWNLHERRLQKRNGKYWVNNDPLLFFHFSGYSIGSPGQLSRHQDRFDLNSNDVLKELFQIYHDALIANDHERMLTLKSAYRKDTRNFFQRLGFGKHV